MLHRIVRTVELISLCLITSLAWAQAPNNDSRPSPGAFQREALPGGEHRGNFRPPVRPGLLFKEEWKQSAKGEHPLTSESNDNPDLDLQLYVPAGQLLLEDEQGPLAVWTGLCASPCAVAFRDKKDFADLSGLARIRLSAKTAGFHHIRPIVKLADGTWWVGDQTTGTTADRLVSEISYADLHWIKLDIKRVVTVGNLVDKIDLSKVDEVGFADLMPGSGHGPGGYAVVGQVEVYGLAVPRTAQD